MQNEENTNMNATELFHQDGKSAEIFYCGQCRIVARSKELAELCCAKRKCQRCGGEAPSGWLICDACRKLKEVEEEKERFEKAEKITKWDGWVFSEGHGYQDGYFESLSEFLDWCQDEEIPESEVTYVWACKSNQFVNADVSDITERICDNAYEDFEPDCLNGLEELKAALEKFNEANACQLAYNPDYTKAVLIKNFSPSGNVEDTKI